MFGKMVNPAMMRTVCAAAFAFVVAGYVGFAQVNNEVPEGPQSSRATGSAGTTPNSTPTCIARMTFSACR